jgi:hypothetical protein
MLKVPALSLKDLAEIISRELGSSSTNFASSAYALICFDSMLSALVETADVVEDVTSSFPLIASKHLDLLMLFNSVAHLTTSELLSEKAGTAVKVPSSKAAIDSCSDDIRNSQIVKGWIVDRGRMDFAA